MLPLVLLGLPASGLGSWLVDSIRPQELSFIRQRALDSKASGVECQGQRILHFCWGWGVGSFPKLVLMEIEFPVWAWELT